jgi:hypothetical protein
MWRTIEKIVKWEYNEMGNGGIQFNFQFQFNLFQPPDILQEQQVNSDTKNYIMYNLQGNNIRRIYMNK